MMQTSPTVLIVDGNDLYRRTVKRMISRQYPSYCILAAANSGEALSLIDAHRPDIIIMDIHLPESNGMALKNAIRNRCPEATLIVLTNEDYPEYKEMALRGGADHFFSKITTNTSQLMSIIDATR